MKVPFTRTSSVSYAPPKFSECGMEINMTKIIHSGDLHFDSPFIGFSPEKAEICRSERYLSFERTIDAVITNKADVLLLAGDIFENEYVSYRTVEFLKRCFSKIPDTYVFISPGNHDCTDGNNVYTSGSLGENVYVFSNEISCVEIKEKNMRVYGYGFNSRFVNNDVLSGFKAKEDGMANVCLMHCSLPPYNDTNPITYEQIAESGFDYIAAGHIHAGGEIKKCGETFYAYCGVPEGVFFDETGEKGIIIGDIEHRSVNLNFVKTAKREVCVKEIDVSNCISHADICSMLDDVNPDNIYKVVLRGKTLPHAIFNKKVLKQMLEEKVFFAKICDETEAYVEHSGSIAENLFIDKLRSKGMPAEIAQRAEKIGLSALRGEHF